MNFNQVETLLVCHTLSVSNGKDAELAAVNTDEAARGATNLIIDARLVGLSYGETPPC